MAPITQASASPDQQEITQITSPVYKIDLGNGSRMNASVWKEAIRKVREKRRRARAQRKKKGHVRSRGVSSTLLGLL